MQGRQSDEKWRKGLRISGLTRLTSTDNKQFKELRRLLSGKGAQKANLLTLEGLRLSETALEAGCLPVFFLISEELSTRASRQRLQQLANRCKSFPDCRLLSLSAQLFTRLAGTDRPQGVIILARLPKRKLHLLEPDRLTRGLLLAAGVQDPGNLGTLIRTAAAFDLDGLVTDLEAASFYNEKVIRSSMGSLFNLEVGRQEDLAAYIRCLKEGGVTVVAAVLPGQPLADLVLELDKKGILACQDGRPRPIALLVGNEGTGLPPELIDLADYKAYIPISAGAESLNVGVAAGILCYSFFAL